MQYRFLCIYMPYRILCIFYSVYVYIVFCCFVPKKPGCFIWKHLVSWSSGLLKFSQSKIPRKFEINRQRVQATQNFFSTFYFGKMLKDPTNSWWEDRVLPVRPIKIEFWHGSLIVWHLMIRCLPTVPCFWIFSKLYFEEIAKTMKWSPNPVLSNEKNFFFQVRVTLRLLKSFKQA